MRTISLTQGFKAIVDDEDYKELSKYKWHATDAVSGNCRATTSHLDIIMARIIMKAPPQVLVDHKNGNTLDNRRKNLRLCTHTQNNQNKRKTRQRVSSKYKGVSFLKSTKKWRVYIALQDIFRRTFNVSLGTFSVEEEAAKAYDEAAREYFGEFARLNFPKRGEQSCL